MTLKQIVFQALKNAVANGYDDTKTMPDVTIVTELLAWEPTLNDRTPSEVLPHVKAWKRLQ